MVISNPDLTNRVRSGYEIRPGFCRAKRTVWLNAVIGVAGAKRGRGGEGVCRDGLRRTRFFVSPTCNAGYRRIHADVIVYIFAHLHTALRAEGNMLDMN